MIYYTTGTAKVVLKMILDYSTKSTTMGAVNDTGLSIKVALERVTPIIVKTMKESG